MCPHILENKQILFFHFLFFVREVLESFIFVREGAGVYIKDSCVDLRLRFEVNRSK